VSRRKNDTCGWLHISNILVRIVRYLHMDDLRISVHILSMPMTILLLEQIDREMPSGIQRGVERT